MSIDVTDRELEITRNGLPVVEAARKAAATRFDIDRLRARDAQEFDALVELESPRIRQLVHRLLGWNECDDVTQDVFITAWESIGRFRGESDVATWLYAIAVNRCRRLRRRAALWNKFLRFVEPQADREMNRVTATGKEWGVEHVWRAINRLSHADRETIVLCCLEENTMDQVASLLKEQKNTIEVRLHRARSRLKAILERMENE